MAKKRGRRRVENPRKKVVAVRLNAAELARLDTYVQSFPEHRRPKYSEVALGALLAFLDGEGV